MKIKIKIDPEMLIPRVNYFISQYCKVNSIQSHNRSMYADIHIFRQILFVYLLTHLLTYTLAII